MTDEINKGPVPNATIGAVNGISKNSVWILGDDIGAPGRVYPDNPQGTSQLGCVKAGTNITIAADGTISATGTLGSAWSNVTGKPFETIGSGLTVTGGVLSVTGGGGSVAWDDITGKPATFTPPIASTTTLGGVKAGTNITIAGDGTISATGSLGVDWANVTNKPTAFPPTAANGTTLGGVKAGTNITIAADGTISATGSGPGGPVDWKDITNKPATFTPPIATENLLGGVKPGRGLNVSADGTLTTDAAAPTWNEVTGKPATFPVAIATKSSLGGVIAGAGVNIDGSGVISVNSAAPSWNDITGKPATFTPPIASDKVLGGVKEGAGINIEADGTINTVQAAPYWDEVLDKPATFPVAIATKNSLGGVSAGPGVSITEAGEISVRTTPPAWDEITDKPVDYPPPIASSSVLGGVKQGNNISIDPDGTISAAAIDIPIASTFLLGGIKVGNGLTIQEDGTLGTEAAAPYWTEIIGKPDVYPPSVASDGVVGGIMPDDNFAVSPSGLLSAKPFTGRPFAVAQYDDTGKFIPSYTMENRNGNLILGGTQPTVGENGDQTGEEVTFGGQVTLMDKSGKYKLGIYNDSLDYDLAFTNGPNIKPGFLPFVTNVVGEIVSVAFGSVVDAIGYATGKKLGVVQVGGNIDVDTKGVISVKTADKSNLGLMIAGNHLSVDKGVVTPDLATNNSPGIVQAGSGLEIDPNGVLSVVNPITFVNRKEVYWGNNYAKEEFWELPAGVDYFRVTCIGQGGWGNKSGGNANTNVGGGGGGSGGWAQGLFYGYKFPAGQKFRLYFTSTNATYPSNAGDAWFGIDSSSPPFLAGCGGGHGEPGNSVNALANGFSQGGTGGAFDLGKSTDKYIITGYGRGQKGGNGIRVQGLSEGQTTWKTIAGIGAPSIHGGYSYGVQSGAGGGATGSGDSNGNVERQFVGGSALIVIEW